LVQLEGLTRLHFALKQNPDLIHEFGFVFLVPKTCVHSSSRPLHWSLREKDELIGDCCHRAHINFGLQRPVQNSPSLCSKNKGNGGAPRPPLETYLMDKAHILLLCWGAACVSA